MSLSSQPWDYTYMPPWPASYMGARDRPQVLTHIQKCLSNWSTPLPPVNLLKSENTELGQVLEGTGWCLQVCSFVLLSKNSHEKGFRGLRMPWGKEDNSGTKVSFFFSAKEHSRWSSNRCHYTPVLSHHLHCMVISASDILTTTTTTDESARGFPQHAEPPSM